MIAIVKVSLPVFGFDAAPQLPVVYERGIVRGRLQAIPDRAVEHIKACRQGLGSAAHFEASWDDDRDRWLLGKPLPWQGW